MSQEGVLKVDFGDGVSALERTMRAITMIADGAIQSLVSLGWNRKSVDLHIPPEDPIPCWVLLRKTKVFEISIDKSNVDGISIRGEWLVKPWRPGIIDRFMGH